MSGWTYMLRCRDGSYYVGSTSYADVAARVLEHNDGRYVGYTSLRRPVMLVWAVHFDELSDAHETERRVKGWSRAKKEALIVGDEQRLVVLSGRRVGQPPQELKPLRKRELAHLLHSAGANKAFELGKRNVPSKRKPAKNRPTNPLVPRNSRHPEVRAERAPKDE